MGYKDKELTEEELKEVTAGILNGRTDEMLDMLSKEELIDLKEEIVKDIEKSKDRELSLDELFNVKAGIPKEVLDMEIDQNSNSFNK